MSGEKSETFEVVEHLFRHESAKMVATLTRIFGLEHLSLAEDVVQEALARALQTWPFYGVPKNPSAWLMRVARNLALDVVRRQKVFREKEPEITRLVESESPSGENLPGREQEIADDRLRMMFVCCHPAIPHEAQVALALKTLGGFSVAEIAHAFLTSDAAIAKRLTRARQKIHDANIRFEIPSGIELSQRLDAVLQSLYLMFNEGYKASGGDELIRDDVCAEAIRLTGMLAEHPAGSRPKTHALLALMLLNGSRAAARVDAAGNLLRLRDQDRSRWNQRMIARGLAHLSRSAAGGELSAYHLQAGISACHCAARDYPATDWRQILALYDRLLEMDGSPVVALNRAVAVAEVHGPQAGLDAIRGMARAESLGEYYLFHTILGEFESQLKHWPAAMAHFRRALELVATKSEETLLTKRLQECEAAMSPTE